ncbi:AraC family transcriptional regulator [Maribacter sp. HTCC2170]|uniref:AraC family transcriptional regulator n=1 Tax=Maribacter sp. (strain HTCC2170 / KCCM 42371) TaxID=313603 RepID=UPI00006BD260|nr:AraC family transcriptional regulator [Maribacter sp. HTCC2170]EAR02285.1 transcriptional regulator [Maribacter sp. HTCC2170]
MVTKHRVPYFLKIWHYHPELELVLTIKSAGTRFVGDSIEKFDEGEVVLIGKNLPHMWLNDEVYFDEKSDLIAEDIVIHFKKQFLGIDFLSLNEMEPIANLLQEARYGIKFNGLDHSVIRLIKQIAEMKVGFGRTIEFIKLLQILAEHPESKLLCSEVFVNSFKKNQNESLDRTYEFVFENFMRSINLEQVAKVANMNPSAFSRFFKRVNRKTFSRYLNEVRIGYACRLILERESNITAICYESGFNNISNFNRQFRSIMNMSPTEYRAGFTKLDKGHLSKVEIKKKNYANS